MIVKLDAINVEIPVDKYKNFIYGYFRDNVIGSMDNFNVF